MHDQNVPVLLVATMDTKEKETRYIESCLQQEGLDPLIMDAGILGEGPRDVAITRHDVAQAAGKSLPEIRGLTSEGEAMSAMVSGAASCAQRLYEDGKIRGIIGLGGTMGTTLGSGVMRTFPVGFPKVMISTIASRDTRSFIGDRDIFMLNSVSDVAGLNRMTRKIFRNGALALSGLVRNPRIEEETSHPLIVLSTLGTTEKCAANIRGQLGTQGLEVVTFHTTGTGGEAMEHMINAEGVNAVVDLSLHELVDHFFGGEFDSGPNRGSAALLRNIPTLIVPGNIDFLVTGPMPLAKNRFPGRQCHMHNASITCVQTTREEKRRIAEVIAGFCNDSKGPVAVLVPLKGFSNLDREGGPLFDPEGPKAFADTFKRHLKRDIQFQCLPYHVNDPLFTDMIVEAVRRIADFQPSKIVMGRGASQGVAEAACNVVSDLEDIRRIQKERILVCRSLLPQLIPLIPQLEIKALIAERGGVLTRTSSFAREYGIPAVVAAEAITRHIKTGDTVRVNGNTGTIEIIGRGTGFPG